ncbi:MAG: hypothetical protein WCZ43_10210 [Proteiniphilum sp.]
MIRPGEIQKKAHTEGVRDQQINHSDFFLKLNQRKPLYKARWQVSMKDQIKNLPEFEKVERELMRHLKKLEL